MPSPVLLHRHFVESWQRLAKPERLSVQRLLAMLAQGDLTPGMRPHHVGAFLSLSPNMDLRLIALRRADSTTLLYVDHHEAAYRWAAGRTVLAVSDLPELIPLTTFAASTTSSSTPPLPLPISEVLGISDPDQFMHAISEMSPEWQEWLFDSYTSSPSPIGRPPPTASSLVYSPVDDKDLEQALRFDANAWTLFLHPFQRAAVDDLAHSVAVTGGPGTGKTVVLLKRIIDHAPKGRDTDCAVLLTYSESLADHLERQLRDVSGRHFYVLPMHFLGGRAPRSARYSATKAAFSLVCDDGRIAIRYRNGDHRPVRELLVDEAQDAPREVLPTLKAVLRARLTRLVLAADLDQSIHRSNQEEVAALLSLFERHHAMTYCYRSTQQIVLAARDWLTHAEAPASCPLAFALSGPRVRFVLCSDTAAQVAESATVLADLRGRHDPRGLALVYCQYFNPSFKGPSDEEELLKNHPDIGRSYRFASLTKGREYFAGVLFISRTFMEKRATPEADRLRFNTLYVALSRFRSEVTVTYTPDCPMAETLRKMAEAARAKVAPDTLTTRNEDTA